MEISNSNAMVQPSAVEVYFTGITNASCLLNLFVLNTNPLREEKCCTFSLIVFTNETGDCKFDLLERLTMEV